MCVVTSEGLPSLFILSIHLLVFPQVFDLVDVDSDGILSWEEVFAADILAIVRQYPHVMPGLDEQDIAEITDQLLQGGGGEGEEEEGAGEGDIQEEEGWENVKEEL